MNLIWVSGGLLGTIPLYNLSKIWHLLKNKQKLVIKPTFNITPGGKLMWCNVINVGVAPVSYSIVGIKSKNGKELLIECREKAFYLESQANKNHKVGKRPEYLTKHLICPQEQCETWLNENSCNEARVFIEDVNGKRYYSKSGNVFKDTFFCLKVFVWKHIKKGKP